MDVQAQTQILDNLYRTYAPALQRMLSRRVGPDEAQDLVQDCYLRLLEQTDLQAIIYPPAFVFTVAGNLASNHIAKASVRARYAASGEDAGSVASEAPSPETHAHAVNDLDTVISALDSLPELCRRAFVLNRIEGMSYVAVSKHLRISEKSVERYIAKALKACRGALHQLKENSTSEFPPCNQHESSC